MLSEYFLSRLPHLLIQRMGAGGIPGVQMHSIIGLGNNNSFDQEMVFDTTRRALAQGKDEPLISLQGKEAFVGKESDVLVIKIKQRRAAVEQLGGRLFIEKAPLEVRRQVDAWGEVGTAARLMQAVKEKFDPQGTLNPGRFVAGI